MKDSTFTKGFLILMAVVLLAIAVSTKEVWTAGALTTLVVLVAIWALVVQVQAVRERRAFRRRTEEMESSQVLLEDVSRQQRAILDGSYFSIIAIDLNGIIRDFNTGAEAMLGYTREEVVGKQTPVNFHLREEVEAHAAALSEKVGREISPGLEAFIFRAREGIIDDNRWTFVHKNGSHIPVSLSITALKDDSGRITGYMGIARDISARKAAERALKASEERTRLFAEYAPAAVAMFDREMRYLVVSQRWITDYHLEGQEIIGRSHYEIFPEINADWKDFHRRVQGGEILNSEADLFVRADGTQQWLSWEVRPWYAVDGSIGGIVMLTQDITARRDAEAALQESEERFRQAFEFAGIGMAIVGLDGRWTRVNQAVSDIVGYEREELLKKTFQEITHPDDLDADMGHVKELLDGVRGFYQMEKRYFHREGHVVWVRLTASLVRDGQGQPLHFIAQIEDVTTRKQLETNLASARDEAIAASRLKSEFLANMSHEIRTPMNGIVGMAGLIMETSLTPEQQEMVGIIQQSSESLLDIINDILDFSKIEAGQLRIHPVEFQPRELVGDVLRLLGTKARQNGLRLVEEFDEKLDQVFLGDAGRLRQVILNLVGNAIKFTPSGVVVVRCSKVSRQGALSTLRCEVIDTGIGISEEAQAQLFRPFSQADGSITRRYGGSGLGLAISRHLIELMGGSIHCQSTEGKGSRFWFDLALPRVEARRPGEADLPTGKRVLLVHPETERRAALVFHLEACELTVGKVAETLDVIPALIEAKAVGRPYDLMILDWEMPNQAAMGIAKALREIEEFSSLPLVVLSSRRDSPEDGVPASIRVSGFLTRPVDQAGIMSCLGAIFRPAATPENPAPESHVAGFHLLLAEDSVVNQRVARHLLQKLGHTVDVAADGAEAVAKLAEGTHYDAVLMDCQMPVMDGYTATRVIRSGETPGVPADIPIIALTANAMAEDRIRCLQAGMTDYLSKPVRPDDLREMLQRCLAPAEAEPAI